MKKILIILSILVVVGVVAYLGFNFYANYEEKSPEELCQSKGGTIFQHSFGQQCEIKAKDAGKKCFFDDDCELDCIYWTFKGIDRNAQTEHEFDLESGGQCDTYRNDNDGKTWCHRPNGRDIYCEWEIS